jgi:HTH-type transcriptional regulator / antitoxin HipB
MDYVLQTPTQLSTHLRALRKSRGLSQAALGQMLGVGQTRVARIEGDPSAVSVEQLIAVLAALNVRLVLRDNDAAAPAPDAARTPTTQSLKRRPGDADW